MMRLIATLARQIEDEVDGALEYAKDAITYKLDRPELASKYHKMSVVEFEHSEALHEEVAKAIEEAEKSGIKYPQSMKDSWESKHRELKAKAENAKVFIGMWK